MTTAPPPIPPDHDLRPPSATDDRPAGPPRRPGDGRVRSGWWRWGFPVTLVLAVIAIPVLVWAGMRAVLDSSDGQLVRRVSNPSAPGWEAVVEKTPVNMVVLTDAQGRLDTVVVFADTASSTGGVLEIPAGTVVPLVGTSEANLRFMFDRSGPEALRTSVQNLLNLTITDVTVVSPTDWAGLVGPVVPLTVNTPDPVVNAFGGTVYPKGSIQLPASGVWDYLSALGPGQSDLSRLVRQQAFWKAWLDAIHAKGGDAAIGAPPTSTLVHTLGPLAGADLVASTLPVNPVTDDAAGRQQFRPIPDQVAQAVAAIAPFPEGAPGQRPHVRVLDGTGQLNHGVEVAMALAAAGAQVDVVGNARDFKATTTDFVYYDDSRKADAQKLRDAIGVGEVVKGSQTNAAEDVTVLLGSDLLGSKYAHGSASVPSTVGGSSGG